MATVAFLTLAETAGFVIDDELAAQELSHLGHTVLHVPWRVSLSHARAYDAAIVRTTWDYHHDLEGFLETIDSLEGANVPVANAPSVIRWNSRKTYLRDLAARGVPIVPTVWGQGALPPAPWDRCEGMMAEEYVLKPVVGANADGAWRLSRAAISSPPEALVEYYASRDWMLQAFQPTVLEPGEFSLFYFGGVYSHAVTKTPKPGDFRVQEEHGGTIRALVPDADLMDVASQALSVLDAPPLQARVDLIRVDHRPCVMELELIEPSLYFRMHERAPRHFAHAVDRWLVELNRRV